MLDTVLHLPPITARIRSPLDAVRKHVEFYYPGRMPPSPRDASFIDFDIRIEPGTGPRRWFRPQARFLLDHTEPFLPLPVAQAAPLLEWGLNWCLATRPLGYLVMHAAVVARDGDAIVMPGFPGAGKSTLCSALTFLDGWRLLSDELAILDPATGKLHPNPRPISLKNASIGIVSAFPGARLGAVYRDTRKGTVTHAAVPDASTAASLETARCRWVILPKFAADATATIEPLSRAETFVRIAEQSFNRDRMGATGFAALCGMLDAASCHAIRYDSTESALRLVRELTAG